MKVHEKYVPAWMSESGINFDFVNDNFTSKINLKPGLGAFW